MQRRRVGFFRVWAHLAAMLCALVLTQGPLGLGIPVASAHAYLLRSDPPANAVLNAPPQMVRLWFSENLNPFTSHAIIVDTTNHEVDTSQGTVNSSNAMEVDVTPLLLRAGTYVVVWRSQSAQDGHITSRFAHWESQLERMVCVPRMGRESSHKICFMRENVFLEQARILPRR